MSAAVTATSGPVTTFDWRKKEGKLKTGQQQTGVKVHTTLQLSPCVSHGGGSLYPAMCHSCTFLILKLLSVWLVFLLVGHTFPLLTRCFTCFFQPEHAQTCHSSEDFSNVYPLPAASSVLAHPPRSQKKLYSSLVLHRNWSNFFSGHVSHNGCPDKMRPSLIFKSLFPTRITVSIITLLFKDSKDLSYTERPEEQWSGSHV